MGAGYVETENQRVIVQTEGQSLNAELLGEVVILHTNNISVRLKDIGRVVGCRTRVARRAGGAHADRRQRWQPRPG